MRNVAGGVLGSGLAELLALEARAAGANTAAAKQVLVVYEEGGISQMDTWDPKPHAPFEHRTPFSPIATNVPGVHFSSLMPGIARHADKLAVVRSMTTARVAGHMQGCQEFFKGYRFDAPLDFPDIGSVVADVLGTECPQLPAYVFCPGVNMPNHVSSPGFLHRSRAPWKLGTRNLGENLADPNWRVRALDPQPGLDEYRLRARSRLLGQLDHSPAARTELAESLSRHYEHAFDVLTSQAVRKAFDFDTETETTRDTYGRGHRGHCYLLGRKLIEAGVRFVTVTVVEAPDAVGRPNYGQPGGVFLNWDHHEGIYHNGPCGGPQAGKNAERYGIAHPVMMPSVDRALAALLDDLHQRGLLAETLVCFITEMGRTPRINKWGGRDHWGRAMSIAFAGAGVPGGTVIGTTDREAGEVTDALYTPCDYAETVYRKLGIDTHARLKKPDGRPVDFSDGGRPIHELF